MQKKRISVPHFLSVINLIRAVSNHVDDRMILNLLVKSTAPAYMYIKDIYISRIGKVCRQCQVLVDLSYAP